MSRADMLIDYVAEHTGISREMLFGRRRMKPISHARQLAWWLIYENCPELVLEDIAKIFDRDRQTIRHGVRSIAFELQRSEKLKIFAAGARKKFLDSPDHGQRIFRKVMSKLRKAQQENAILKANSGTPNAA